MFPLVMMHSDWRSQPWWMTALLSNYMGICLCKWGSVHTLKPSSQDALSSSTVYNTRATAIYTHLSCKSPATEGRWRRWWWKQVCGENVCDFICGRVKGAGQVWGGGGGSGCICIKRVERFYTSHGERRGEEGGQKPRGIQFLPGCKKRGNISNDSIHHNHYYKR